MTRIILLLFLLDLTLVPEEVRANRTSLTRQQIRSLPVTARPNRPGHVYGNTVRRATQRRSS